MSSEEKSEPKVFWDDSADRSPTGEFPPLTAADVEKQRAESSGAVSEGQPEEEDWLKTALFKTSHVQPAQPPKDLASSIAISVQPTGEHPSYQENPQMVLRPAPAAPLGASFIDSARSMARPIAGVALGLMVAGAAIVFVASQNPDSAEVASSNGTQLAESPPLAPALVEDGQASSGSADPGEVTQEESTTTTAAKTTTTKAEVEPQRSELSEKTKTQQPAPSTTTTTQAPRTEPPTSRPTTTEATTTQPPTTAPPTTEAPTTQPTITVEDPQESVD